MALEKERGELKYSIGKTFKDGERRESGEAEAETSLHTRSPLPCTFSLLLVQLIPPPTLHHCKGITGG
jgi:hypothetical protein